MRRYGLSNEFHTCPAEYRFFHTPKAASVVCTTQSVLSKYISHTGSLFKRWS